jgi:leader peptidase (prepilin peptidase)/N-methyltransferase
MNLELLILAIPFGYLIAVSPPLAIIDIRSHRLPNAFTVPGIAISLISVFAAATVSSKWLELVISIGVSVLILIIGFPLARADLLGMGDIKLLIAFALPLSFISPLALLLGVLISLLIANAVVLPRLVFRKMDTSRAIAMGPYLLLGLIGVFGYQLWDLSPVGVWS